MKETRSNAVFVAVQYSVQLSAAAAALVTYRTNKHTACVRSDSRYTGWTLMIDLMQAASGRGNQHF